MRLKDLWRSILSPKDRCVSENELHDPNFGFICQVVRLTDNFFYDVCITIANIKLSTKDIINAYVFSLCVQI